MPGLLQRILGTGRSIFTGGPQAGQRLSPEDESRARRDALINAGLTTILQSTAAGAPPGGQADPVAAIIQGALAGRETGGRSRAAASQLNQGQAIIAEVQRRAAEGTLTQSDVLEMMVQTSLTNPELARSLGEVAKTLGPQRRTNLQAKVVTNPDGTREYANFDPATGKYERTGIPAPEPTPLFGGERDFDRTNTLARSFEQSIADHIAVADNYGTVLAAAQNPSAAGDLSLVFAYMKMIDPGSVVRESEFATAQNAPGVPDRIRAQWNRLLRGERFTPESRQDFVDRAQQLAEQRQTQLQPILARFRRRAAQAGVDPDLVLFDPFEEVVQRTGIDPEDPFGDLIPGGGN